ncbi:MAG: glycogen synthase GlgA [Desulfomonile sp.]|nr:glycogen synthase GlgA [Desulfomonile sp.]
MLMLTPEATPFAQTGGLGEVMAALPAELVELGVDVDVLMPKYRGITRDRFPLQKQDVTVTVDLNARPVPAGFWEYKDPRGVRYIFLENDAYYDREGLYGTKRKDYEDNAERFVFLTRAAIEMTLALGVHYDVFHCHDWQAALTPVYLRTLFAGEEILRESASVMTIHNLGYQGVFWHLDMPLVGVGWEFFNPAQMEFHGRLNFLKSGIVFADEVNTVSPGYREEILTPEYGCGLEGVLQEKAAHVSGILNGVNYSVWDPATDPFIAAHYSPKDLAPKAACKADLQRIADLRVRPDVPLIGMVTRLSTQKGMDILESAFDSLMMEDIQLVILGTGEARFHDSLVEYVTRYPQKTGVFLRYDDELAHKIFAGSDILLVPSRYEPCGLTQLYALKYGTVPIVRATGGLNDSVVEFDPAHDSGTGFKFSAPDPVALEEAVMRAINVYKNGPSAWKRLMVRGMNEDFSWSRSARAYRRLYDKALQVRKEFLSRPAG